MKKIFFLLLLLSVFGAGCKKDDSNPISEGGEQPVAPAALTSISGQLKNWSYYKTYQVSLGSYGSSVIDGNGNFNITNLTAPSDAALTSVNSFFGSSTSTTLPTISDNTAKFVTISALSMAKVKNPTKSVGMVYSESNSSSMIGFSTSYVYFDKPVTINGTITTISHYDTMTFTQKVSYNNLAFSKGWNKIVYNIKSFDYNTGSTNVEILHEEPSSVVWDYTDPITTVTITGNATVSAGLKFPLCIDKGHKISASIYTSNEIGGSGLIEKLAWKAYTNTSTKRPVKIYLKEVSSSTLSADSVSSLEDGATLVYDGSAPLLTGQWNWNAFDIADPFSYSGKQNLLVIVETAYSGVGTADDGYCEFSILSDNKSMTWEWNNSAAPLLGIPSVDRPNIEIIIDRN